MSAEFVTPGMVRAYLDVTGTVGKYDADVITSNIRAASAFLERATHRQFEAQTATTKTFTTNGQAAMRVPDLRSVTSVTLQGAALIADESYYLIPDAKQSGIYTTIQFRPYGQGGRRTYLSNPEWFDRNLDRDWLRYGYTSLPNDLVITGDWGHDPLPEELLHATKVLAAWYTKRPASVLANVAFTPEGNVLNYSDFPPEVSAFIKAWTLGVQLVAI